MASNWVGRPCSGLFAFFELGNRGLSEAFGWGDFDVGSHVDRLDELAEVFGGFIRSLFVANNQDPAAFVSGLSCGVESPMPLMVVSSASLSELSSPTQMPVHFPSNTPSHSLGTEPSDSPTSEPYTEPSSFPSGMPSVLTAPSSGPTSLPSTQPSMLPSSKPSMSSEPSESLMYEPSTGVFLKWNA
jgi:hypothetical protein